MCRKNNFFKTSEKHPFVTAFILSVLPLRLISIFFLYAGTLLGIVGDAMEVGSVYYSLQSIVITAVLGLVFGIYPGILILSNLAGLFSKKRCFHAMWLELATIFYGTICTILYEFSIEITFDDWNEPIYAFQKHTPILSDAEPTFITIMLLAFAGYVILKKRKLQNTPPLLSVFSLSAVYLGCYMCIMWCVQVQSQPPLCLLAGSFIVICSKTVNQKIYEWNKVYKRRKKFSHRTENTAAGESKKEEIYSFFARLLGIPSLLPLWSVIFLIPFLGILFALLFLLGQTPDYLIRMWTETSDWALSTHVPPPPLEYPGHYLCTAAANGHKSIVKPIRMGIRHSHKIPVNRQLLIANAFEQIIEEKTPKFHRVIRYIYDKYGFPTANLIKGKFASDAVYILMKPLEWVFLTVIYLCDAKPENRIALQYFPKNNKKIY